MTPGPRTTRTSLTALLPLLLTVAHAAGAAAQAPASGDTVTAEDEPPLRDPIGDLNADAVRAGSFPGAILLPGTDVSLAVGGSIKTVVIVDSHIEASGADLLAASIGTRLPDVNGDFNVDATLSKIHLDGRASTSSGLVRGYIEWDFNASNNGSLSLRPRLVYGSWATRHGTLIAGHHWATFMNVGIIPEGLTEPTVSGAVFARQAQVRWTQRFSVPVTVAVALESSAAGDFLFEGESVASTRWPDAVLAAEWNSSRRGTGVRAAGIVRRVADRADPSLEPATGWGVNLGGGVGIASRDRLVLSGTAGEGIARYVIGNGAGASGTVEGGEFLLLRNYGALGAYRRGWTDTLRSSLGFGRAWTRTLETQPDDAFDNSTYGYVNLMWSAAPFLTVGMEYAYARLEFKDGSSRDNNRLVVGVQMF